MENRFTVGSLVWATLQGWPAMVDDSPETGSKGMENRFTVGSLVWATLQGWPAWPAMVDDSPKTGSKRDGEPVYSGLPGLGYSAGLARHGG